MRRTCSESNQCQLTKPLFWVSVDSELDQDRIVCQSKVNLARSRTGLVLESCNPGLRKAMHISMCQIYLESLFFFSLSQPDVKMSHLSVMLFCLSVHVLKNIGIYFEKLVFN